VAVYVLDTDHLSLILRGHPKIRQRLTTIPPNEIAITIITAEEQLRGRLAQVSKANDGDSRSTAYRYLHQTITDLARLRILDYDARANGIYEQLQRQRIRIGSQDLRIAAVTLASGGLLVTRNSSDFKKVPGLTFLDWTT
jgi:tRNA(fMet)-specific endonuclease VapC